MKKTIKSLLKIESGDIGMMIAGGIIDYFLYSGSTSETVVEVGIIMAIASYVLYELIFEGIGLGQIFNNSLAMGVTRKRLFPSYVILCIMKNTIGLLIIIVLGAAERFYCRRAFPDNVKEDVYMILFTGRGLFITISLMFLVSIIAVFVGALILRFGKKAFWPLWAVWMMAWKDDRSGWRDFKYAWKKCPYVSECRCVCAGLEHYIPGFVRSILSDHVQSDHKKAERNILAFQNLRI